MIDNHGDLGVSWRLSAQLANLGHRVRLWIDDASALAWMAPQLHPGIEVRPWSLTREPETLRNLVPSDVWVEAFGCEIEKEFVANYQIQKSAEAKKRIKNLVWINLEYLTAEPYARRCHGLPSPVLSGPASGQTKHFYYPGFADRTGGLLREPDLAARQAHFDRGAWLASRGIRWQGERLISLFCYEPPALPFLLQTLAQDERPTRMLVTPGRPAQAVAQAACALGWSNSSQGMLHLTEVLPETQTGFDELLWACDLNFVRGEDSLVRALWAGQPFIWQIYPQEDGAHWSKLDAFLDWLQPPMDVRTTHHHWNSIETKLLSLPNALGHHAAVKAARDRALGQPDLATQLQAFVARSIG